MQVDLYNGHKTVVGWLVGYIAVRHTLRAPVLEPCLFTSAVDVSDDL